MSALVKCGECNGQAVIRDRLCEWCEGTGKVELPDGYRPRRVRTPDDRARVAINTANAAVETETATPAPDALVLKMPPARASVKME